MGRYRVTLKQRRTAYRKPEGYIRITYEEAAADKINLW